MRTDGLPRLQTTRADWRGAAEAQMRKALMRRWCGVSGSARRGAVRRAGKHGRKERCTSSFRMLFAQQQRERTRPRAQVSSANDGRTRARPNPLPALPRSRASPDKACGRAVSPRLCRRRRRSRSRSHRRSRRRRLFSSKGRPRQRGNESSRAAGAAPPQSCRAAHGAAAAAAAAAAPPPPNRRLAAPLHPVPDGPTRHKPAGSTQPVPHCPAAARRAPGKGGSGGLPTPPRPLTPRGTPSARRCCRAR
jgi:hypothetical protein